VLRRELSELPATRPRIVSKQKAIAELTAEFGAAQRRGYTIEDLAQLLADRGLAMTPGTLRGYLRRNRKKRRPGKNEAGATRETTPDPGANKNEETPAAKIPVGRPPSTEQAAVSSPLRPAGNASSQKSELPVARGATTPETVARVNPRDGSES
jgi:hypothetical protein